MMTRRGIYLSATAIAVGSLLGCHAVLLKLERGKSAGIFSGDKIEPQTFFDGHAIPLPAKPFANCFDVLADEGKLPKETCAGGRAEDYLGYAADMVVVPDAAPAWLRDNSGERWFEQTQAIRKKYSPRFWLDDVRLAVFQAARQPAQNHARPILSFAHFSDAQIREPAAKLGGAAISDRLDPLIPTFAHDYEQELFSAFFYEAIVRTVQEEVESTRETRTKRACDFGTDDKDQAAACVEGSDRKVPDALAEYYRIAPTFMIHTGDSADAGLLSEFAEFRSSSDLLSIPWYSVVGNHDILGIGNLQLDSTVRASEQKPDPKRRYACTSVDTLLREYYIDAPRGNGQWAEDKVWKKGRPSAKAFSFAPIVFAEACIDLNVGPTDRLIGDRHNRDAWDGDLEKKTGAELFIEAHCRTRTNAGVCSPHVKGNGKRVLYPKKKDSNRSVYNGFDLNIDKSDKMPGYYAFKASDATIGGRQIWAVVLNTSSEGGAYGAVCSEGKPLVVDAVDADDESVDRACPQLTWLKTTLKAHSEDLVMVFAHHPIYGIQDRKDQKRLKEALFSSGNVIAYFAGHTHSPGLRVVEEDCTVEKIDDVEMTTKCMAGEGANKLPAKRLWEVIAPSTIEFPQFARQVTLFEVPDSDLLYFEYLSFSPHLKTKGNQYGSYVERAESGAKRDKCHESPEDCQNGEPKQPEQYLSYARLWLRVPTGIPLPAPVPPAAVALPKKNPPQQGCQL
jgi:Calcineurin-like phosphoesterase